MRVSCPDRKASQYNQLLSNCPSLLPPLPLSLSERDAALPCCLTLLHPLSLSVLPLGLNGEWQLLEKTAPHSPMKPAKENEKNIMKLYSARLYSKQLGY